MSSLVQRACAAWATWYAAAGPWRRWALCLPLVAPGLAELGPALDRADHTRGRRSVDRLAHDLAPLACVPTLLVLDLAPEQGVRTAATLAHAGIAWPVLHLGRWPYREAILPSERLVQVLLDEATTLSAPPSAPSVALVLDGERRRPVRSRPLADRRADNRYLLGGEDLPDARALADAGIRRVMDIRPVADSVPPPLQVGAYMPYRGAGLTVERWWVDGPSAHP